MLPFLLASLLALPGAAVADGPALAQPAEIVDLGPAMDLDWHHAALTGELRAAPGGPGSARDEEDLENRDLYPLGDADDDGRDDVLAVLWYEEELVFQALSGRDGSVLWERVQEDDDDGFLTLMGDVNKDDVLDLAYIEFEYQYNAPFLVDPSTLFGFSYDESFTLTYDLIDGRDLAPFFTWEAEGEFIWEYDSLTGSQTLRYRIPGLGAHPDLPGAMEYITEWSEQENNEQDIAGLVKIGHEDQRSTLSLRGIDMDGEVTWSASADEEGTSFYITGLHDMDGDGIRDFVLTGSQYIPADRISIAGSSIGYPDSREQTQVFGRVFDGAAGTPLLDWASGPRAGPDYVDGLLLPAGDRNGDGQEYSVLLLEYRYETGLLGSYDLDWDFGLLFLSSDGDELERHGSDDELLAAAVFADVDGDGDDEMELLRAPLIDSPYGPILDLDHAEYGIAQGDLSYVWSKEDLEDDFPTWILEAAYGPDFTGDDVPEVVWVDADYDWVAARDGTDGTELWRFALDEDDVEYLDLGPDLDDDGGVDLLWLEFEQDEDAEDEWTRLTGANLTALRGSDAAVFWQTAIYARQPNETLGAWPWVGLYDAGDMDGDGAPDILVNVEGAGSNYEIVCEDGYCWLEETDMPEDMEVADVAFPLSGLRGDALTFDEMADEDYAINAVGGPSAGPAQADLEEAHDTPMLGVLPLLALVAIALWLRRR